MTQQRTSFRCRACIGPAQFECFDRCSALGHLRVVHLFADWPWERKVEDAIFAKWFQPRDFNTVPPRVKENLQ
jgi:hypothetical protein